jgi:hypothetical protein
MNRLGREPLGALCLLRMRGAGFAVTKGARRITRIGGRLRHVEKAAANRKNRRHAHQQFQTHGEDADLAPKLWTERNVL